MVKVRAKTTAVISLPSGALLPIGKGKIVEVSQEVYNSCWELLERLEDEPAPEKPIKREAKLIESAMVAPEEVAVKRKARAKK